MARRFLTDIDLLGFSLLNALMHPVSADPTGLGTGDAGRVWFNTTDGKLKVWNGTSAIDFLSRANHTGTQTASTISDLASVVKAYTLDEFGTAAADVDLGGNKIINLSDGTSDQDAVTVAQLNAAVAGISTGLVLKGSVKVAATANVSISSPGSTIDGITMAEGDVVLLTGQSTGTQNGPYVYNGASSAMTRAENWDSDAEAVLGSFWVVQRGTNADTLAVLSNDTEIEIGTSTPTFVFRGAAGASYTAGDGIALSGSEFSVEAGDGLTQEADGLAIDTSVVARKVTGAVPSTTSGIFTVSGSDVVVNHQLGNSAPDVRVVVGSSAPSGLVTGQVVEVEWVVTDSNNITITFPEAPAANNYIVTVEG